MRISQRAHQNAPRPRRHRDVHILEGLQDYDVDLSMCARKCAKSLNLGYRLDTRSGPANNLQLNLDLIAGPAGHWTQSTRLRNPLQRSQRSCTTENLVLSSQ